MGDGNVQFFAGMEIVDVGGAKIGSLIRYDERLGYLETQGAFPGPRYIPFHAIESVKPAAVRLNVTRDVVSATYRRMPDPRQLRELRDGISEGTPVLDQLDQNVGTVEAYDRDTGYMRIDDGLVAPAPLFLPATAIGFVDDRGIHLNVDKDAIVVQFTRVPEVAREALAG